MSSENGPHKRTSVNRGIRLKHQCYAYSVNIRLLLNFQYDPIFKSHFLFVHFLNGDIEQCRAMISSCS